MLRQVELPVRQLARESDEKPGGFEVDDQGERRLFTPVLGKAGGREVLVEDVALFYRALNPDNEKRTVTICNGNYGRGTYGAVRALTDARFRDRNASYVRSRFRGRDEYCILSRVQVRNGQVVTPDWNRPDKVLHEWAVSDA
jgi:hypothetical protein